MLRAPAPVDVEPAMQIATQSSLKMFVERLSQRSPLTGGEVEALLGMQGYVSMARANIDIVSLGEVTTHAILVLDGLAGRFGQVIDGRRQITALYVAGDMCDLHSVVTPSAGWAVQALSPTAILRVPHAQLLEVARAYPNVAEAFWRDCSVDASVLSQWVVNVGRRDARSRLAHLICEMATRMENARLGTRQEFRLLATQAQLSDALGMTAVHVNRTLRSLRKTGLVETTGHQMRILDWRGLVKLGDFDEEYLQIKSWRADPMMIAS
jgi:CRP-like cAMP-binding protein